MIIDSRRRTITFASKITSTFILGVVLILQGCTPPPPGSLGGDSSSDTGGGPSGGPTGGGVYYIPSSSSTIIAAEHGMTINDPYIYVSGESRKIYVYGTRPANSVSNNVWWTYGSTSSDYNSLSGSPDGYWDNGTRRYTTPLSLDNLMLFQPQSTPYELKLNLGSWNADQSTIESSCSFYVKVVATNRVYSFKYSYQSECDVFNNAVGYSCDSYLTQAFKDAGTDVTREPEKSGLLKESVSFMDPTNPNNPDEGYGLLLYIASNINSDPSGVRFRLVSIFDALCTTGQLDPTVEGYTARVRNPTTGAFRYGYSYVFYDRTKVNSGDRRRKDVTRVVLHELGHLRGQDKEITDNLDQAGNNGFYMDRCLMLHPTQSNLDNILTKMTFCAGHRQFLLDRE